MFKKITKIIIFVIITIAINYSLYAENDSILENIKKVLPDSWEIYSYEKGIVQPMHRPKGEGESIFLNPKNNKYFGKTGGISIWIMDEEYGFPNIDKNYDSSLIQAAPSRIFGTLSGRPIFMWGRAGRSWPTWEEDILKAFGEKFSKK